MIATVCHDINVSNVQGYAICAAVLLLICLAGLLFMKLDRHLAWAEKRDARKAYVADLYTKAESHGKPPTW